MTSGSHSPGEDGIADADILDAEIVPAPDDFTSSVQAPSFEEVTGYTEAGIPTFDHVRDKIEHQAATALGGQELAEAGRQATALDEAMAQRDDAAKDKLAEIRKSMGL